MAVPLRQQGEFIGGLIARRTEVRPFTSAQIKLLETFADQALIAIENVRLFQELTESLEQQTATSEILGVIASSPTEIQPVLDVVAENAGAMCDATDAHHSSRRRECASDGWPKKGLSRLPQASELPIDRGSVTGRVIVDRQTIHIHDLMAIATTEFPGSTGQRGTQQAFGLYWRCHFFAKESHLGAINIRRTEVRPFTDRQIALLKTFADQAVIAIENVRLFKESRSATQNCARPWSIRRQPPKCSASSAARRRTCSRSSTPSSRAQRGFVGLMTWCCDSAREPLWFRGLILVPYPLAASRSVLMSHALLDARAWHTPHSRRPRAEMISQR